MPLFAASKNPISSLNKQMIDMLDKLDPILTKINAGVGGAQSTYRKVGGKREQVDLVTYDGSTEALTCNHKNLKELLGGSGSEPAYTIHSSKGEFEMTLTFKQVELFVQKYEFCRELKSFLSEQKKIDPSQLQEKLKELTGAKKYPRALEGHFSNTKSIVKQLQKQVLGDYANKAANSRHFSPR